MHKESASEPATFEFRIARYNSHKAKGNGHRATGKGQRAKGNGQRATGNGQRAQGQGKKKGKDEVRQGREGQLHKRRELEFFGGEFLLAFVLSCLVYGWLGSG